MKMLLALALSLGLGTLTAQAAFTITFDAGDPIGGLTAGTTLSNQYAALGVTFSPNAFSGPGGSTGTWATNTDMTIVTVGGGNTGGLGAPALVSGNLLRSFNGWLAEDGDPSFLMTFSTPMSSVSMDFAGVAPASLNATGFQAFDANNNLLGTALITSTTGQNTLSFSSMTGIASVIVIPGNFNDWVGVDNITLEPASTVPVPPTAFAAAFCFAAIGVRRFRKV